MVQHVPCLHLFLCMVCVCVCWPDGHITAPVTKNIVPPPVPCPLFCSCLYRLFELIDFLFLGAFAVCPQSVVLFGERSDNS